MDRLSSIFAIRSRYYTRDYASSETLEKLLQCKTEFIDGPLYYNTFFPANLCKK